MKKRSSQDEPFWMDEPDPYAHPKSKETPKGSVSWWVSRIFLFYSILIRIVVFVIIIYFAIKYPFFWVFAAFQAISIAVRLLFPYLKETSQAKALRIQQLARDKTGADYLGSAIHTAGHPLLQINQPVVLALKDSELSIYSYDSPFPVDTLSVNELHTVDPVVFDDDRVPHIGVIDNTAQALQISFQRQNAECTCSFRRMYKIRPIEWYHAIQEARFMEQLATG